MDNATELERFFFFVNTLRFWPAEAQLLSVCLACLECGSREGSSSLHFQGLWRLFKSGRNYFLFFLAEHIFETSGFILVNNCDRKSPKEALGKDPE